MSEFRTPKGIVVPASAVSITFTRSSGPGGQHVNKTSTKVRVAIDLGGCGFSDDRLAKLTTKLGPEVQVSADDHRSQWRNRELAVERALAQIDRALEVPRPRRPSRPSLGSKKRRLEAKSRQSQRKVERRRPDWD